MIVVWSAKGGSGSTVTACAIALRTRHTPTTLIDLAGDVPAALGIADPAPPGVGEWLRSPTASAGDLARLAVPVVDGVLLVPLGADLPAQPDWGRLADALADLDGAIVDAGHRVPGEALLRASAQSLLVTRNCYISLKRAVAVAGHATGVVLVAEPGRPLGRRDVEATLGCRVVAEIPVDPAVGRAVDAGLLRARLPLTLASPLRSVA